MGTGKQYDEEFKKQAIKLASFRQQTNGSKSLKRKTVSLKSLMNFWRKHLLFSLRTVGSQERRTVKVHSQNVNFIYCVTHTLLFVLRMALMLKLSASCQVILMLILHLTAMFTHRLIQKRNMLKNSILWLKSFQPTETSDWQ